MSVLRVDASREFESLAPDVLQVSVASGSGRD